MRRLPILALLAIAGDVAVSGGSELRLRLWRPRIVVPVSLGVFGLADAGRADTRWSFSGWVAYKSRLAY